MITRYGIFCTVIETGNFTRAAELLGYSQSSVSQTIKSLENELGVVLIDRKKDGVVLTKDGSEFFPYIMGIYNAEKALSQKKDEMMGLKNSVIRIGTFTSVSRTILPQLMNEFQRVYPFVTFILRQGDYTSIGEWIKQGEIDFGFVNRNAVSGIEMKDLYEDDMVAIFPVDHPLADKAEITMKDIAKESLILIDEGEYSAVLESFSNLNLKPNIKYKVYDDYTILAMVRQNLGISLIYKRVVEGFEDGLIIRKIKNGPKRIISLAWKNKDTVPYAAAEFAEYIYNHKLSH